jgi:cysteine desulfurase
MSRPIYLDYNATTPIAPEVAHAMQPFLLGGARFGFGNPSSAHPLGIEARAAVDEARGHVASLLGAIPEEICFTSGGSESNNLALKGAAWARRARGRHLVISAVEHPAVEAVCGFLVREGWSLSTVPVDGRGLVDPADVDFAIQPDTVIVSVMHANNETGAIQPIAEIARVTREKGVLLHVDGAQAVGKIPARVEALGMDLYSLAGHKFYAPKGVGALYVRGGLALEPLVHGAGHEQGRRAGTENLLGIVGLGAACALAARDREVETVRQRRLRDLLQARLQEALPGTLLNGPDTARLPNTLNVSLPGVDGHALVESLRHVVAISAGSACHAGCATISPVLEAMGLPVERAMGAIRLSVGRFTREEDVARAARCIVRALRPKR